MKTSTTICIAGGHLSPAYALASYVKKQYQDISIIFIGRERAFTSKQYNAYSSERDLMSSVADHVEVLPIERPDKILAFIRSILSVSNLLSKQRPSAVVSFGGYVGFVVGMAAWMNRIPLIIHEQTHTLGMSNKMLGFIARKICVSYSDMASQKLVYTGFPLRKEMLEPPSNLSFQIQGKKPILYITGGTTGAVFLNDLCFGALERMLSEYTIVHQTGAVSFEKANLIRQKLPDPFRDAYTILPYIEPADTAWLLHHAALIISRAGANIVYELAFTKTRSVLIPLPSNREQKVNAQWLTGYAQTAVLIQEETTSRELFDAIERISHSKQVLFFDVATDGTQRLCEEILSSI